MPRVFVREKGTYPEMIAYFAEKFNPRKETLRSFVTRSIPKLVRFLRRRRWNIHKIWRQAVEIIDCLAVKREAARRLRPLRIFKPPKKFELVKDRKGEWRAVYRDESGRIVKVV